MQASGLTEFNSFICISAIWGQSCSLVHLKEWQMAASCILPAPQQSPWGVAASRYHSFGSLHLHLETRNHWWLWHFLFIDMAANIFISQTSGKKLILCVISWDVTSPVFNLFLGTRVGVVSKREVGWWERIDTAFLILTKFSQVSLPSYLFLFHLSFPRLLYLFMPQADIDSSLLFSHV